MSMNNLIESLKFKTAWDMAAADSELVVIHPRGCGKSQYEEIAKAYLHQKKADESTAKLSADCR